jgi:uncharacterized membrane-anchored protein
MSDDLRPLLGGLPEHPERAALSMEVHARPPMRLAAPAKVTHLVMLSGEAAAADERAHLGLLADALEVALPHHAARQYFADFGAFKLRWERHTEFAAWTFVREGAVAAAHIDAPFADLPIAHVPGDWLAALPGELLARVDLTLLSPDVAAPADDQIEALFDHAVGGRVADGAAQVWTDFHLYDGATRILVHDLGLSAGRRGRLVQRLLEIETYRMLALLAFPLARAYGRQMTEIDTRLADLTQRLRDAGEGATPRALLDEALALGAEVARIASATNYRIGAARAYHELVERRIDELREQRGAPGEPGLQPIGQFLRRRLTPAVRTCESLRERLETASRHLARAANLLRSRIELDLAEQNRAQLVAMNRRSRLQLRLQQTVEGLSVAAISYYVVRLVAIVVESLPASWLPLSPAQLTGLAVPVVLVLAWLLIRRIHKALTER